MDFDTAYETMKATVFFVFATSLVPLYALAVALWFPSVLRLAGEAGLLIAPFAVVRTAEAYMSSRLSYDEKVLYLLAVAYVASVLYATVIYPYLVWSDTSRFAHLIQRAVGQQLATVAVSLADMLMLAVPIGVVVTAMNAVAVFSD